MKIIRFLAALLISPALAPLSLLATSVLLQAAGMEASGQPVSELKEESLVMAIGVLVCLIVIGVPVTLGLRRIGKATYFHLALVGAVGAGITAAALIGVTNYSSVLPGFRYEGQVWTMIPLMAFPGMIVMISFKWISGITSRSTTRP